MGEALCETGGELMRLCNEMHEKAVEITGDPRYQLDHTISYEEFCGSIADQQEYLSVVSGPGFEDVRDLGEGLIKMAEFAMGAVKKRG